CSVPSPVLFSALSLHDALPISYYFKVVCIIDDMQLLAGSLLLVVLYLLGFFTGVFILKLISFLPILYFLFLYYINRKDFIQITPDRKSTRLNSSHVKISYAVFC